MFYKMCKLIDSIVFFLCLLCVSSTKLTTRTNGSLTEYNFLLSQCQSQSYLDISKNKLLGNLHYNSTCLLGNGIQNMATSSTNMNAFSKTINRNSFTTELWLQLNTGLSATSWNILSFRQPKILSCSSFEVNTQSKGIEVSFCNAKKSTMTFNLDLSPVTSKLHHIVMTVNFTSTLVRITPSSPPLSFYGVSVAFVVNGIFPSQSNQYFQQSFDSSASYSPSTWPTGNYFYLLGGDTSYGYNQPNAMINLFYFAIYNKTLSNKQILNNYQAALPRAAPVLFNSNVTIQQDGEVGDHSRNPEYYIDTPTHKHIIPSTDLAIISLPLYDIDNSVISPNYNSTLGSLYQLLIQSLPDAAYCQLYYLNGTAITSIGTTTGVTPLVATTTPATSSTTAATTATSTADVVVPVISTVKTSSFTSTAVASTVTPSVRPSARPLTKPVYAVPSSLPSLPPSLIPTSKPASNPISTDTALAPSMLPTFRPTFRPTVNPTTATIIKSKARLIDYDSTLNAYAIRIRPATGIYSKTSTTTFCSFNIRVVDKVSTRVLPQAAKVSVIVTHVDKPPTPLFNLSNSVYANHKTILTLTGRDTDSAIRGAYITNLPSKGKLYLIFPNGSISNQPILLPTKTASPLGYFFDVTLPVGSKLKQPTQVSIAYEYTGTEHLTYGSNNVNSVVNDGWLGTDSFGFRLSDYEGRYSIPAVYNLTVYTSVVAYATGPTGPKSVNTLDTAPLTIENTYSPITLYGQDFSSMKRVLSVKIVSLPIKGQLYQMSKSSGLSASPPVYVPLRVNDILNATISYPYTNIGVQVYYLSKLNYFTYPRFTVNGTSLYRPMDSFQFLVVASATATSVTQVQSAPVTQSITIRNINQPTELSFNYPERYKNGKVVINAYSSVSSPSDTAARPNTVILTGFKLTDPDSSVGVITVYITTKKIGGYINLNQKYIPYLDFNSDVCYSNPRWFCYGRGYDDKVMRFIGEPWAVEGALNGFTYKSIKPYINDNISITISDGENGNCLDNAMQSKKTIRSGCFNRQILFQVSVLGYSSTTPIYDFSNNQGIGSLPLNIRITIYVSIGLCFLMCCRCLLCLCRCLRCRKKKRNNKQKRKQLKYIQQQEQDRKKNIQSSFSPSKNDRENESLQGKGKTSRFYIPNPFATTTSTTSGNLNTSASLLSHNGSGSGSGGDSSYMKQKSATATAAETTTNTNTTSDATALGEISSLYHENFNIHAYDKNDKKDDNDDDDSSSSSCRNDTDSDNDDDNDDSKNNIISKDSSSATTGVWSYCTGLVTRLSRLIIGKSLTKRWNSLYREYITNIDKNDDNDDDTADMEARGTRARGGGSRHMSRAHRKHTTHSDHSEQSHHSEQCSGQSVYDRRKDSKCYARSGSGSPLRLPRSKSGVASPYPLTKSHSSYSVSSSATTTPSTATAAATAATATTSKAAGNDANSGDRPAFGFESITAVTSVSMSMSSSTPTYDEPSSSSSSSSSTAAAAAAADAVITSFTRNNILAEEATTAASNRQKVIENHVKLLRERASNNDSSLLARNRQIKQQIQSQSQQQLQPQQQQLRSKNDFLKTGEMMMKEEEKIGMTASRVNIDELGYDDSIDDVD